MEKQKIYSEEFVKFADKIREFENPRIKQTQNNNDMEYKRNTYLEPKHIESSYNVNGLGKDLYDLVVEHKPLKIIDFGILYGYSTVCLAQAVQDNGFGEIVAYDLFEDYEYKNGVKEVVKHNLDFYNCSHLVKLEQQDFYKWLDNPTPFDLLHVDISNTGDILIDIKEKLGKFIDNGSIVVFEGGGQIRDEIEWMEKYEATKMFPLRETLNYKVLRNDYPTLSAFKNNKIK
tara:strand:- start:259 stop:951 length:693 start_codon:yes stop_codon:yes gene_type:complete